MVTTQPGDSIEHGTPRGYQQHREAGTPPCDACRRASADYQADWRARTGSRDARRNSYAVSKTIRDMRRLYPITYRRLYEQHAAAWERENGAEHHDT